MSNAALQQAIEAADDQRYQAMFKLDYAAMETIFGDDLAYTHSSSVTDSKASYIAAMKSGKYRYVISKLGAQALPSVEADVSAVRMKGNGS